MDDPIRQGLARGWKHIDAATLSKDTQYEADIVIVGTGAGGGIRKTASLTTGIPGWLMS